MAKRSKKSEVVAEPKKHRSIAVDVQTAATVTVTCCLARTPDCGEKVTVELPEGRQRGWQKKLQDKLAESGWKKLTFAGIGSIGYVCAACAASFDESAE